MPHTGYPSTLPVVHTGYPSTLPVAHTGYPSTLPLSHTDSTRFVCLCYTREKQLSLNNAAIKPSSADVNTVQTVSLLLPMSVPFRPCLFFCRCQYRSDRVSSSADVNTVQTVSLLLPMSVPFRPCLFFCRCHYRSDRVSSFLSLVTDTIDVPVFLAVSTAV